MERTSIAQQITQVFSAYGVQFAETEADPRLSISTLDLSSVMWLRITTDLESAFQIELELQEWIDGERLLLADLEQWVRQAIDEKHRGRGVQELALFPGVVFKPGLHCVEAQGEIILLTEREKDLLLYLWNRRGRFVGVDEIMGALWDEYASSDSLRQYIYRLRKKIRVPTAPARLIIHVRGLGYMLVERFDETILRLAEIGCRKNSTIGGASS